MEKETDKNQLDLLLKEHKESLEKLDELEKFIESGKVKEEVKEDYLAFLLILQKSVMGRYLQLIECRMGALDPAEYHGCEDIEGMPFGIATFALKEGFSVRRKSWENKDECVIKRGSSYKGYTWIASEEDVDFDYNNQLILFDKGTGIAKSNYIPSVEDIFKRDWEIVHEKQKFPRFESSRVEKIDLSKTD